MHPSRSVRPHAERGRSDESSTFEVLAFGEIELDLGRFELRRSGLPTDIEPKAFDLLVYLARHPDQVVTKTDLARDVWQQEYISEAVVNRVIGLIRKAIGDNARDPKHVHTVFRRGYRFVGDVSSTALPKPKRITQEVPRPSYVREISPREEAFVGRDAERVRCVALLEGAVLGQSSIALVSGEPGSGKTRFLDVIEKEARTLGMRVVHARAEKHTGTSPSVLRALTHALEGPAEALPFTSDGLVDVVEKLLLAAHEVCEHAALLVVVDDVHHADEATLDALAQLAVRLERSRAMLMVGFSDSPIAESLWPFLARMRTRPRTARIELSGVDAPAVLALARLMHGAELDAETAEEIVRTTAGNVGLVSLLVEAFVKRGVRTLPTSVVESVEIRCRALSPACAQLLRRASVLGRVVDARVLRALGDEEELAFSRAITEATDARLLVSHGGRLEFAHAIVRDALYEKLDLAERASMHLVAARVLVSHTSTAMDDPALVARHFGEAAFVGGAREAVLYGDRAAEQSAKLCAYDDAVSQLRQCLDWLEGEPADHATRCRTSIKLAAMEHAAGEYEAAQASRERALALAQDLGDVDLCVEALIPMFAHDTYAGPDEGTLAGGERALAQLGEERTARRALLLAHVAAERYLRDADTSACADIATAEAIARELGDPATIGGVLRRRLHFARRPRDLPLRIALAEETVDLGVRADQTELVLTARMVLHDALLEQARVTEAREQVRLIEALARKHCLRWPLRVKAVHACMQGRFAETERLVMESLGSTCRDTASMTESFRRHQLIVLYVEQGRDEDLMKVLDVKSVLGEGPTFVKRYRSARHAWEAARAQAHVEFGDDATARAITERLAREAFATLADDPALFMVASHMAEVLPRLGESELARKLYHMLSPYAERLVVIEPTLGCYGSVHMQLGQLARAYGAEDVARRHFERALVVHRALGAGPLVARTLFELGCVLRTKREDEVRIAMLLGEARQLTETLGLARLEKRMAARLGRFR